MTLPAVGVVGTGAMGLGITRSLIRAGATTYARDVDARAEAAAVRAGARAVATPAELASHASIAILVVVDQTQIDDVAFGPGGFAGSMTTGAVVVICSTVDPLYVASLAERLQAHRIAVVDAPISGGPAKAANGSMTMMVSGSPGARARCAPLFAAMAGRIFEVGDRPGQAATFKIVNNLLAAVNLAAGAEALALARSAGIDAAAALEVIGASSGASWIVADRMPRALAGDSGVRAAAKILAKDAAIAQALAERLGAAAPFARTAATAFRAAVEAGHGEADDSIVLELATRLAPAGNPARPRSGAG